MEVDMRKLVVATIAIAASMSFAWAQGTTSPAPSGAGTLAPRGVDAGNPGPGAAPIGHRQPRRADVPDTSGKADTSPEDRALDRKIKSICRGC
jgi:hypothetical protein